MADHELHLILSLELITAFHHPVLGGVILIFRITVDGDTRSVGYMSYRCSEEMADVFADGYLIGWEEERTYTPPSLRLN